MITLTINGLPVMVEEGTKLLEAARFLGFPIPTLCHMDGLTPYGACRLCVVEIGEGPKAKLVSVVHLPGRGGAQGAHGLVARGPGAQDDPGAAAGLLPAVKDRSRTWPRPTTCASSASGRSTRTASSAACACGCARSR